MAHGSDNGSKPVTALFRNVSTTGDSREAGAGADLANGVHSQQPVSTSPAAEPAVKAEPEPSSRVGAESTAAPGQGQGHPEAAATKDQKSMHRAAVEMKLLPSR